MAFYVFCFSTEKKRSVMCDSAPVYTAERVVSKCLLLRLDVVCALVLRGSELITLVYYPTPERHTKLMTHLASLYLTLPSPFNKPQNRPESLVMTEHFFPASKFKESQRFDAIETIEMKKKGGN